MLKNIKKILLLTFLSISALSCSLVNETAGKIQFYIPNNINYNNSKEAIRETPINVNVIIKNKDEIEIYNENHSGRHILIDNIPTGLCNISISWKDEKYSYFGQNKVYVKANKTTPVEIKITKTPIKTEGGESEKPIPPKPIDPEVTLESIGAEFTKEGGALYDDTITIDDFAITGHYSDGNDYEEKASDYEIEGNTKMTSIGDVSVVIKNIKNQDIKTTVNIKCYYDLPNLTATITSPTETTLSIPQFTGNETIILNIEPDYKKLPYPNDKDITTIEWFDSDSADGNYTLIDTATDSSTSFTIPNDTANTKFYKAEIITKPSEENKNFCSSQGKKHITEPIAVTVKTWNLAIKDADLTALKTETTYDLVLTNEAAESLPEGVSWKSSETGFSFNGNKLKTPTLNVGETQTAKISAMIGETEIASIDVTASAKTLSSIEAKPKASAYVLYGNSVDIAHFTITEHYSDNTVAELSDNSGYEIANSQSVTKIGPNEIIIQNKNITSIQTPTSIDCKYNLPEITLQINESGTPQGILVPQYTGSQELKAIVSPASFTAPNDTDTITYQWKECGTKDGNYSTIPGATSQNYSVPVDTEGKKYYKCIATVKPSQSNAAYCLQTEKTATSSNAIDITVEPWNLTIKDVALTSGTATLEDSKAYNLVLTNTATKNIPTTVSYKSTSTAFAISGTTLTPTASETEQTGTISAVIGSGSNEKTLASISVTVPAKEVTVPGEVSDFTSLQNAITSGLSEITLTGKITMKETLTISQSVTIKSNAPITIDRYSMFKDEFFNVTETGKLTLGDSSNQITIEGGAPMVTASSSLIKVASSGELTITNCILQNNNSSTVDGGAINNAGNCNIDSCTICNNSTNGNGGGIININGKLNIKNSLFGSTKDSGSINNGNNGGAIAITGGEVYIDNNTNIQHNTANTNGGGLWINGGTVTVEEPFNIANNTIVSGEGWNVYVSDTGTYNGTKGPIAIDE